MSRPRVIKNKGVAVVEGTPAASLIKDVDRFFASKPRERMAGENIGEARTIQTEDNTMFMGGSKDFNEKTGSRLGTRVTAVDSEGFTSEEPQADTTVEGEIMSREEYQADRLKELKQRQSAEGGEPRRIVKRTDKKTFGGLKREGSPQANFTIQGFPSESPPLTREETDMARQEFIERKRDRAKERANRFRGRRSAMEAERSTEEQKATEGKFISTLRR